MRSALRKHEVTEKTNAHTPPVKKYNGRENCEKLDDSDAT
jgi:hypothetical protein